MQEHRLAYCLVADPTLDGVKASAINLNKTFQLNNIKNIKKTNEHKIN